MGLSLTWAKMPTKPSSFSFSVQHPVFFIWLLPLSPVCWGCSHNFSVYTPRFSSGANLCLFASLLTDIFLIFFFLGCTFHMHHHLMICLLSILLRTCVVSDFSCFHQLFKHPLEIHPHLNIAIHTCQSSGKPICSLFLLTQTKTASPLHIYPHNCRYEAKGKTGLLSWECTSEMCWWVGWGGVSYTFPLLC